MPLTEAARIYFDVAVCGQQNMLTREVYWEYSATEYRAGITPELKKH